MSLYSDITELCLILSFSIVLFTQSAPRQCAIKNASEKLAYTVLINEENLATLFTLTSDHVIFIFRIITLIQIKELHAMKTSLYMKRKEKKRKGKIIAQLQMVTGTELGMNNPL